MKDNFIKTYENEKTLIKKCHICGHIIESLREVERCPHCNKAFLPINYFEKIMDAKTLDDYGDLFESSSEIDETSLVRGIHVIW